jgi:hypothetical protein
MPACVADTPVGKQRDALLAQIKRSSMAAWRHIHMDGANRLTTLLTHTDSFCCNKIGRAGDGNRPVEPSESPAKRSFVATNSNNLSKGCHESVWMENTTFPMNGSIL